MYFLETGQIAGNIVGKCVRRQLPASKQRGAGQKFKLGVGGFGRFSVGYRSHSYSHCFPALLPVAARLHVLHLGLNLGAVGSILISATDDLRTGLILHIILLLWETWCLCATDGTFLLVFGALRLPGIRRDCSPHVTT